MNQTRGNRNRNELITQSLTVPIPKYATVVMTEYLGLLSRQKLVHEIVVITVGGTRRNICLCKEGFEGARPGRRELPDGLLTCSEVEY